jgi:hypothetical protein
MEEENKGRRQTIRQQFHNLLYSRDNFNRNRRRELAFSLLRNVNTFLVSNNKTPIAENAQGHSVDEHLSRIQEYFDRLPDPNERCRIVVFNNYGMYKPVFKGPMRQRYDLCLYLVDGHFYGIRRVNVFLSVNSKYCIDCEGFFTKEVFFVSFFNNLVPYKDAKTHRVTCKAKCTKCTHIGLNTPFYRIHIVDVKDGAAHANQKEGLPKNALVAINCLPIMSVINAIWMRTYAICISVVTNVALPIRFSLKKGAVKNELFIIIVAIK